MPRPKKDSLPSPFCTSKGWMIQLGGRTFNCGPANGPGSIERADQLLAMWLMLGRPEFESDSPIYRNGNGEVSDSQIALSFLAIVSRALDSNLPDPLAGELEHLSAKAADLAYRNCEQNLRQYVLGSLGRREHNEPPKPERKGNRSAAKPEPKPAPKADAKGGAK